MFTQCPSCETTFQVTADQLKAANGDVRCGQCLTVFSALDNLSEKIELFTDNQEADTPAPAFDLDAERELEPETDAEVEAEAVSEESVTDTVASAAGDTHTSIDKNLEEFFGDLFEDSPDESFDKPIAHASPDASIEESARPDGGFFFGANEATIEKILEEKPAPDTTTRTEAETETLDESELLEPPIETKDEVEVAETLLDLDNETEQAKTDTNSENKTRATDTSSIPDAILDELQAAKAQQLKPPNTGWVVGSIVLMLVFVFQAVYFSRDSLAKNPSYRPLLTSACNVLGCEINVAFDTRLIEIIGRDVRSHPSSKKALIAGTTLINNATYAQPYPLLTLTFSDITGTKLAQRRFTPSEYLRSGTNIEAGMPSKLPVQVELHLVDPGKAAINFEFHAEVDPRS